MIPLIFLLALGNAVDANQLTLQRQKSRMHHRQKSQHAKTLDQMEHYLWLESSHSATHILKDTFGCTFKHYWSKVLETCKDGTLAQKTSQAPNSKLDVKTFCSEIEKKCADAPMQEEDEDEIIKIPEKPRKEQLAPLPWCTYSQVMPPDMSWIVIAADDGMQLLVDSRQATITIIANKERVTAF